MSCVARAWHENSAPSWRVSSAAICYARSSSYFCSRPSTVSGLRTPDPSVSSSSKRPCAVAYQQAGGGRSRLRLGLSQGRHLYSILVSGERR